MFEPLVSDAVGNEVQLVALLYFDVLRDELDRRTQASKCYGVMLENPDELGSIRSSDVRGEPFAA